MYIIGGPVLRDQAHEVRRRAERTVVDRQPNVAVSAPR
jgi:hypothetical protein